LGKGEAIPNPDIVINKKSLPFSGICHFTKQTIPNSCPSSDKLLKEILAQTCFRLAQRQ
jgi:hypothetical protein